MAGLQTKWFDLLGDMEPKPSDHEYPFHRHGAVIVLVGPRSILQQASRCLDGLFDDAGDLLSDRDNHYLDQNSIARGE